MMIFRVPGPHQWEGISYEWKMVDGDMPEGWHETIFAAIEASKPKETPLDANDDGEVTRAEMEQKARELGLKFDGRTSNKKLLAMIEEALK